MVIIKIERKTIYYLSFCVLFFITIIFLLITTSNRKISISAFLISSDKLEEDQKQIELFDISAGKVVARFDQNAIFQKEANNCLENITGIYGRVKAFPDSGHIFKIPLSPPVIAVDKHLIDCGINSINEVYVIFPVQSGPYLLLMDDNSRPLLFNFNANTDVLKSYLIDKDSLYENTFRSDKSHTGTMEELYHDISMTLLFPYIPGCSMS